MSSGGDQDGGDTLEAEGGFIYRAWVGFAYVFR